MRLFKQDHAVFETLLPGRSDTMQLTENTLTALRTSDGGSPAANTQPAADTSQDAEEQEDLL